MNDIIRRKAFTLVELLVVIAIVAVLATVSIVGYSEFIKNAYTSNDTVFIKQLNTALACDLGKHKTFSSALKAVENVGYKASDIKSSTEGNEILWDQVNDTFVLLDRGNITYVANVAEANKLSANDYRLWKIYDEMPDLEDQTYSIYWNGDNVKKFEISVGFDAGKKAKAIRVFYYGTEDIKDDVIIKTNSGQLSVNAENDTIKHFGHLEAYFERSIGTYTENGDYDVTFDSTTKLGSRYAADPSRKDRMQINENIYLDAGITVIFNTEYSNIYEYQIGKLNDLATPTLEKWIKQNEQDWGQSNIHLVTKGLYTFNFRLKSGTDMSSIVNDLVMEDILEISYFGINNGESYTRIDGYQLYETIDSDYSDDYYGMYMLRDVFGEQSQIRNDGFIYRNKAIYLDSSNNVFGVKDFRTGEQLSNISIDKFSTNNVHGNSVHMGIVNNELYAYVNVYNAYTSGATDEAKRCGECAVYKINLSNSTSELVQLLKIDFACDGTNWPTSSNSERPFGNFIIDDENNKLYVYVVEGLTTQTQLTRWFTFDLPSISEGTYSDTYLTNLLTLRLEDVKDSWIGDYMYYMQGVTVFNGLIYTSEGVHNDAKNKIRVIDPIQHKTLMTLNLKKYGGTGGLTNMNYEPQFLCAYNSKIYFGNTYGLFELIIE